MLRRVDLVRSDISEDRSTSIIIVTRIGELGTTLAITSNWRTHYVPMKNRFLQEPRGVTSQKTSFFIENAQIMKFCGWLQVTNYYDTEQSAVTYYKALSYNFPHTVEGIRKETQRNLVYKSGELSCSATLCEHDETLGSALSQVGVTRLLRRFLATSSIALVPYIGATSLNSHSWYSVVKQQIEVLFCAWLIANTSNCVLQPVHLDWLGLCPSFREQVLFPSSGGEDEERFPLCMTPGQRYFHTLDPKNCFAPCLPGMPASSVSMVTTPWGQEIIGGYTSGDAAHCFLHRRCQLRVSFSILPNKHPVLLTTGAWR
jgi:hypothetical protein